MAVVGDAEKKEVASYQKVLCQIHLVQELFYEVDRVKENESFKKFDINCCWLIE